MDVVAGGEREHYFLAPLPRCENSEFASRLSIEVTLGQRATCSGYYGPRLLVDRACPYKGVCTLT